MISSKFGLTGLDPAAAGGGPGGKGAAGLDIFYEEGKVESKNEMRQ